MKKEDIADKIRLFFESHDPNIAAVYLFGSIIDRHRFSDVDIALLLRKAIDDPLAFELKAETLIEKTIHHPVDIRILNGAPLSFAAGVLRNGQLLLDRDPDLRADFASLTFRKYFDFSHFRTDYLKEVKHAPI